MKSHRIVPAIVCIATLAGSAMTAHAGVNSATITNLNTGVVYPTIQAALDAATTGDVIDLSAGVIYEDNIVFPNALDVTIQGAGMDQTFINGGADDDDRLFNMFGTGQTLATVIRDMTLTNTASPLPGGVCISLDNTDATIVSVAFRDSGGQNVLRMNNSDSIVDRCVFSGNSNSFGTVYTRHKSPVFSQCLYYANTTTFENSRDSSDDSVVFVNCTFASGNAAAVDPRPNSEVTIINCVSSGRLRGGTDGIANISYSLYPDAPSTDGNVAGVPTFVDAGADDYRLAPGSLGIDAADADAYMLYSDDSDLAGDPRFHNDFGMLDTGVGAFTYLDMGALEFQGFTPPCNAADFALPFGVLDFSDVIGFLQIFGDRLPDADLAEPFGQFDFSDVLAFLAAFGAGCP
ncbi:MAG: right-handed parallel beta-helix repeat-containing protein [Phycisphaerales bacterium]